MSAEQKSVLKNLALFIGCGGVIFVMTVIFNGGGFIATTNATVKETKDDFKTHINDDVLFQKEVIVKITRVEVAVNDLKETFEAYTKQSPKPVMFNEHNYLMRNKRDEEH
jgi:hypothetical protein